MFFTFSGVLNVDMLKKQSDQSLVLLDKAPSDLRVIYDGRDITKAGMDETMFYRKFVGDYVSKKTGKAVAIVPNSFFAFLGKIAFTVYPNHKVFYKEEYDKALAWVKS